MVGKELLAMNSQTATAAEVNEIIGNQRWCCPRECDECGAKTWGLVQLGQEPDDESNTAEICGNCLTAALRLLGAA
jgi:hypothetical protein